MEKCDSKNSMLHLFESQLCNIMHTFEELPPEEQYAASSMFSSLLSGVMNTTDGQTKSANLPVSPPITTSVSHVTNQTEGASDYTTHSSAAATYQAASMPQCQQSALRCQRIRSLTHCVAEQMDACVCAPNLLQSSPSPHTSASLLLLCAESVSAIPQDPPNRDEFSLNTHTASVHNIEVFPETNSQLVTPRSPPLKCPAPLCSCVYTQRRSLVTHIRSQHGDAPLSCIDCRKTLANHTHFLYHKRTCYKGSRALTCRVCGVRFTLSVAYRRHMQGHRSNACTHCPLRLSSRKALLAHLRHVHRVRARCTRSSYSCDVCGQRFSSRELYNTHLEQTHHTHSVATTGCAGAQKRQTQHHQCPLCQRLFTRRQQYIQHMKFHALTKCPHCSEMFESPEHKQRHLQEFHASISQPQQTRSSACEQVFATTTPPGDSSTLLKRRCLLCRKCFWSYSQLLHHLNHQHEEDNFRCHFCYTECATALALHRHLRTSSHCGREMSLVVCHLCGVCLRSSTHLQRHIRKQHPAEISAETTAISSSSSSAYDTQITQTIVQPLFSVVEHTSSILQPLSSVVQHTSSILQPLSSVVEHTSSILQPLSTVVEHTSSILQPLSSVVEHTSSILQPLSSVVEHTSSILQPLSSVVEHTSSILQPLSSVVEHTSSILQPLSSVVEHTSSILQPLSSVVEHTSSILQPLSTVVEHTSSILQPLSSVVEHTSSILQPLSSVVQHTSSILQPLSSVVTSSSSRLYACCFCAFSCARLSSLRRHEQAHLETNRRRYVCDVCGARLQTLYSLQEHQRYMHATAVHERRKFSCTQCDKLFKTRSAMHRHARTHSSLRAYVCELCARAYKRMSHLRRHHLHAHKLSTRTRAVVPRIDTAVCVDPSVVTAATHGGPNVTRPAGESLTVYADPVIGQRPSMSADSGDHGEQLRGGDVLDYDAFIVNSGTAAATDQTPSQPVEVLSVSRALTSQLQAPQHVYTADGCEVVGVPYVVDANRCGAVRVCYELCELTSNPIGGASYQSDKSDSDQALAQSEFVFDSRAPMLMVEDASDGACVDVCHVQQAAAYLTPHPTPHAANSDDDNTYVLDDGNKSNVSSDTHVMFNFGADNSQFYLAEDVS